MNKEHSSIVLLRSVGVYDVTSQSHVVHWCTNNPSTRLALQLYKIDLEMLVNNPRKCVPFYYELINSVVNKKEVWRTPEFDTQYAPGCCPNCKKDVLHCVCTDPFSYFTYDRPPMPRSKALKAHWEDPIHSVNPHPHVGPVYTVELGEVVRDRLIKEPILGQDMILKCEEVRAMMKDVLDNRAEGSLIIGERVKADQPQAEEATLLSQCLVRTTPNARHEVVMGREYEYDGHVVVAVDSYRDKYKELSFILVDDEKAKRLIHVRMEELYDIYPDCVYRLIRTAIQDDSELGRFLLFIVNRESGYHLLSTFIAQETGENNVARYTKYVHNALLTIAIKRKEKADAAAANK